jgi:hypothetical protein
MRSYFLIAFLAFTSAHSAPRDAGTWRFVCDYYNLDVHGNLTGRQRVSAQYARGLPGGKVQWSDVTVAEGKEWADVFPAPRKREFMEGFNYPLSSIANMMQPDFFTGFPTDAHQERNLVWDVHMFEQFAAAYPDKLRLNTPYHAQSGAIQLADAGTFTNHDTQLTLTGVSGRGGEKCALIDYTAFFNKVDMTAPGMHMQGRSHYWGQIWVGKSTRRIKYATLFEDVLGDVTLSNQPQPMVINVFRKGVFEPVPAK